MTLQLYLVFLILLAAIIHAAWNAVVKASGDRFLTFTIIHFTGTLLGLLIAPFVGFPDSEVWPYLLFSVIIHNIYYVFLLLCYRHGDLSEVYPIARGASPVLVALLAFYLVDEAPSQGAMLGIGIVSLGVISLMFAKGRPNKAGLVPILLALITAVMISSYTVVDGLGLRAGSSPWPYIVWLNLLEGIPFALWAIARRSKELRPFLKANWKRGSLGGCLTIIAYGLVLYALDQGAMAHVSALRETSVLFAAIIGTLILKESFGVKRIISAGFIVGGVILLQVSQ
jgi:drug/metabolite transporter (DMT)-like permease